VFSIIVFQVKVKTDPGTILPGFFQRSQIIFNLHAVAKE